MTKIDVKKKQEERIILDNVFGSYDFNIEDNEPLDFLLSNNKHTFGVEITRLYYNEGFGRLSNLQNYKTNLMRGKNIHKDDYNNLKIRSSYLLLPTDNQFHFAFNKIMYTKPTEEKFTDLLVERIKNKNAKAKQYSKVNVEWIELIISDENGYFDGGYLSKKYQQILINEVDNSIFETVYILSSNQNVKSLYVIGKTPEFLLNK